MATKRISDPIAVYYRQPRAEPDLRDDLHRWLKPRESACSELREHALVIGEVTLTSGRTAQYYVDAKRAILLPAGFRALGELVARRGRARRRDRGGRHDDGRRPDRLRGARGRRRREGVLRAQGPQGARAAALGRGAAARAGRALPDRRGRRDHRRLDGPGDRARARGGLRGGRRVTTCSTAWPAARRRSRRRRGRALPPLTTIDDVYPERPDAPSAVGEPGVDQPAGDRVGRRRASAARRRARPLRPRRARTSGPRRARRRPARGSPPLGHRAEADHQRAGERPRLRGDVADRVDDHAGLLEHLAPDRLLERLARLDVAGQEREAALRPARLAAEQQWSAPSTTRTITTGSVRGKWCAPQAGQRARARRRAARSAAPQLAQKRWRRCQAAASRRRPPAPPRSAGSSRGRLAQSGRVAAGRARALTCRRTRAVPVHQAEEDRLGARPHEQQPPVLDPHAALRHQHARARGSARAPRPSRVCPAARGRGRGRRRRRRSPRHRNRARAREHSHRLSPRRPRSAGRAAPAPVDSSSVRVSNTRTLPWLAGAQRPVRWCTTSSATCPPTNAQTGPSVRRRGRAAALLDDVVVELVRAPVRPLLAVEAAGLARHVQRPDARERREVAHRDVRHAVLEAGGVHPALDVVGGPVRGVDHERAAAHRRARSPPGVPSVRDHAARRAPRG